MHSKSIIFGLAFLLISSGMIIVLPQSVLAVPNTHTWDGGGLDVYAGTHDNWVSDIAPTAGDAIVFDAGALPCTWNLSLALDSFTIAAGYSGVITQSESFSVTSYSQVAGTFTPSYTKNITDSGDFSHTGGTLSPSALNLIMTGAGSTFTATTTYVVSFQASASVTVASDINSHWSDAMGGPSFTIDPGATVTINSGKYLRYTPTAASTFTNDGIIAGAGTLQVKAYATDKTITFGVANCPTTIIHGSDASANRTISLGDDTEFGSTLSVYSSHATQTITLSHGTDYTLSVTGKFTLGDRGLAVQGTGTWTFANYTQDGVTSEFTQGGSVDVASLYQSDGVFTGNRDYVLTDAGDFCQVDDANLTNDKLRIRMTGDGSVFTAQGLYYRIVGLQVSADVLLTTSDTNITIAPVTSYLTIDADKTLTIASEKILYIYTPANFTLSNSGTIAGPGEIWFRTYGADTTLTFGDIDAPVQISSGSASSQTVYLGGDTTFSNLALWSEGVTGTNYITLDHGENYSLTVDGGFSQGNRANICQGTVDWEFGVFEQLGLGGVFTQDEADLILHGNYSTTSLSIPNLIIADDTQLKVGSSSANIALPSYYNITGLSNFSGPANVMTEAPNGDYLGFIREGDTHVAIGDYGVMNLYRSTDDGAAFIFEAEIQNIAERDVRNFAAGVSDTGRIFAFFSVLDVDNGTWDDVAQYIYSDDNGTTWNAGTVIVPPAIDGITLVGGSPYGSVRACGDGRVGVSYYGDDGVEAQVRYLYSDDDGATWNHVAISQGGVVGGYHITETDILYLEDDNIVAMSRINGRVETPIHISTDNGLTWTNQGNITKPMHAWPPTLATVADSYGRPFVLTIWSYYSLWFSFAKVSDILERGPDAWSTIVRSDPGYTVGMYATLILDSETGDGVMMVNNQVTLGNETISGESTLRIVNITTSIESGTVTMGNLTVETDASIVFDASGLVLDYFVVYEVVNNGMIDTAGKNMNISGGSSTPLMGFGDFDGVIYLNGSLAESYNIQMSAPSGVLHTDRDTTINIDESRYLRITPSTTHFFSISMSSLTSWSIVPSNSSTTFSLTVSGLDSTQGYRVYQDGVMIAPGTGPGFSFTAIGGGDFEIIEWYGKQVSSLILLTVNMVGLGIIVTVLASYISPIARDIQDKRPIKPEKLTENLIRTVIFIVVASLMWGVLHSIAIG